MCGIGTDVFTNGFAARRCSIRPLCVARCVRVRVRTGARAAPSGAAATSGGGLRPARSRARHPAIRPRGCGHIRPRPLARRRVRPGRFPAQLGPPYSDPPFPSVPSWGMRPIKPHTFLCAPCLRTSTCGGVPKEPSPSTTHTKQHGCTPCHHHAHVCDASSLRTPTGWHSAHSARPNLATGGVWSGSRCLRSMGLFGLAILRCAPVILEGLHRLEHLCGVRVASCWCVPSGKRADVSGEVRNP